MTEIDISKIPDCTSELEKRVSANADALIALGLKEWYRTRRRNKQPKKKKVLEDQLREIEDNLVEDDIERT